VSVASFALRSGTEYRRHVIETFHVGLRREVQVATVCLRFTGESVLEVLFRTAALQILHIADPPVQILDTV
jgi:hypothetical protein